MPARAGYCDECGADTWLRDGGGCVFGHNPQSVRSARIVPLPPELDKFNWGAFFFPVLWPLVKGPLSWAGIFFGIGIVGRFAYEAVPPSLWPLSLMLFAAEVVLEIWYSRNANRLLWERNAWQVNVPALARAQRNWGLTGLIMNSLVGILFISLYFMPAS